MQQNSMKSVQLQFSDAASCKRWILSLPLTNVQIAHQSLAQQVALVAQAGIPPVEVLRIVEALREPLAYVQNEIARRYTGKALPLEPIESAAWTRVSEVWQGVIDIYLACREAQLRGDRALEPYAALILMRCLQYSSCMILEHHRVYSQVPAAWWKKLHHLYLLAEQSGCARTPVTDAFSQADADSSCQAAYCRALLSNLANPFALSGRQMEFLARWTEKWSALVDMSSEPLPPSSIPALAIDLAGDSGPVLAEGLEPQASLRYLDFDPLSRTLRQVITLLKQGKTPAQLGLGDDARQPGCENLLMLLYIQWCRAGTSRVEPRSTSTEKTQICLGMRSAHFYISGRAFRAPGAGLTRQEEHDMQLFGHISQRTQQMMITSQSAATESWDLVNQSASGFLCMQRDPGAQARIAHNQLIAVRRSSSKHFHLGVVQWLRIDENKEMFVGIRLFAGAPRPVAVRPVNFNLASNTTSYERGLFLPGIQTPPTPATLILPTGWFQPGRIVEVHAGEKRNVTLVSLLEKGTNFDRCTVAAAQS
jgi:hypothetical protein